MNSANEKGQNFLDVDDVATEWQEDMVQRSNEYNEVCQTLMSYAYATTWARPNLVVFRSARPCNNNGKTVLPIILYLLLSTSTWFTPYAYCDERVRTGSALRKSVKSRHRDIIFIGVTLCRMTPTVWFYVFHYRSNAYNVARASPWRFRNS